MAHSNCQAKRRCLINTDQKFLMLLIKKTRINYWVQNSTLIHIIYKLSLHLHFKKKSIVQWCLRSLNKRQMLYMCWMHTIFFFKLIKKAPFFIFGFLFISSFGMFCLGFWFVLFGWWVFCVFLCVFWGERYLWVFYVVFVWVFCVVDKTEKFMVFVTLYHDS